MKIKHFAFWSLCLALSFTACGEEDNLLDKTSDKEAVDCVNPYIGNISHLLVPTYPTVHLPNSMMRVYPAREDFTAEVIEGLPLIQTSHRGQTAFRLSPVSDVKAELAPIQSYIYDQEVIKPYFYSVYLPEQAIALSYAPATQSAIYEMHFQQAGLHALSLCTEKGLLRATDKNVQGYQIVGDSTKVYLYMEFDRKASKLGTIDNKSHKITYNAKDSIEGENLLLRFGHKEESLKIRYGISYISTEQARANVLREVQTYELELIAKAGRNEWEKAFSKVEVEGGSSDERAVFYTALYRTYERMINISEDGRYYSASDGKVHQDEGVPFYTDDWIWDTYLAVHPLRTLLEPEKEQQMLRSYLRMAEQSPEQWLPTFPEVTGDTHRMNGNHSIASFADAYSKGLTHIDLAKAYDFAKKTMKERSFLPWTKIPKGKLSEFMDKEGYFPALRIGEKESDPRVTLWEKRQAVAVTLATCYDYFALSQMAKQLGKVEEAREFLEKSYNYRKLYNEKTGFFHPKDKHGKFIEPFDYELSGGLGVRDYYDENNAYTYRWDVKHNPKDLIKLMGGDEQFISYLDESLRTPLSKSKWQFYSQLPDQTGNVGQLSFGNEPSMHIPYLYNYAKAPWRTQRAIKKLIHTWFRNDLMGVPGDEDGGGLSAFVVFSMMGFYPVTPALPIYSIGSPFFPKVKLHLAGGRTFTITAKELSPTNIYIQSAKLNGKELNRAWLKHSEIIDGGELVFEMGKYPNKQWGIASLAPSAEAID